MEATKVGLQGLARFKKVSLRLHWSLCYRVEKVEVGQKLDVRDTEYIWCIGTVKVKIESPNRDTVVVIHYDGWNKYFDEILPLSSSRVSPLGLYTKREDIPRY